LASVICPRCGIVHRLAGAGGISFAVSAVILKKDAGEVNSTIRFQDEVSRDMHTF
jgi:hypothetical protein